MKEYCTEGKGGTEMENFQRVFQNWGEVPVIEKQNGWGPSSDGPGSSHDWFSSSIWGCLRRIVTIQFPWKIINVISGRKLQIYTIVVFRRLWRDLARKRIASCWHCLIMGLCRSAHRGWWMHISCKGEDKWDWDSHLWNAQLQEDGQESNGIVKPGGNTYINEQNQGQNSATLMAFTCPWIYGSVILSFLTQQIEHTFLYLTSSLSYWPIWILRFWIKFHKRD